MEVKLQRQINDYFPLFEEFHNTAKASLIDCQKRVDYLNKLISRCKNVTEADVSYSPLEEFADLQSKLSTSLQSQITDVIDEIRGTLQTLEDSFEKLCHKNGLLRETIREIKLSKTSPLLKGSPNRPPLIKLVEFLDDTISYGTYVCSQIETSVKVYSYRELYTESLIDNLRVDTSMQRRVYKIISYTSFLSDSDN